MRRISPTWLAIFALIWWILGRGHGGAPLVGVVAVAAAVLIHAALGDGEAGRGSIVGALRFLPFFVVQSLRGGWNVARTALSPGMPLAPAFVLYRTRITEQHARVFFLNTISLLPGTFSARLSGPELTIHLLTRDASVVRALAALEERVAGAFGLELSDGDPEWSVEAGQPPAAGASSAPGVIPPASDAPGPASPRRGGDGSPGARP